MPEQGEIPREPQEGNGSEDRDRIGNVAAGGFGSSENMPFKDIQAAIELLVEGKTEDQFEDLKKDSQYIELTKRKDELLAKAKKLNLTTRINRLALSKMAQLRAKTVDVEEAASALDEIKEKVMKVVEEPEELKGVVEYFTQRRKEDLNSYIQEVEQKHTELATEDIPTVLDETISEWERLRIYPKPYEEDRILTAIARLPSRGKLHIYEGGDEVNVDEFREHMLARMNFLRVWCISNNEEGGANPKQMAEAFNQWHDGWVPSLFKHIKTKDGEELHVVLKDYLRRYEEEDTRLQEWIKNNQNLEDDDYDDQLEKKFRKMLIGANADGVKALREEFIKKYGELAERIGFEFTHTFFSSYFDRGLQRRQPRKEIFADGTRFSKVIFGNSPYNNQFIDHLPEFMSKEGRGRPEVNEYFSNLSEIIKPERIDRDFVSQFDKGAEFDENIFRQGGTGFKFSEIAWEQIKDNPSKFGMGLFFTVYDDREKSAAMRAAVQDFLQGASESTFMEVVKNYRSTRSGLRDPFVKDFTDSFVRFMRTENRALFDDKNWNTRDTEKFILKLKAAKILHYKDANEIMKNQLGMSVDPISPILRHIYTPLKQNFPDSRITEQVEKWLASPFLKKLSEKFHIPGWWWVRDMRKYFLDMMIQWAIRAGKYTVTGK